MCGLWGGVSNPLSNFEVDNVVDLAAFNTPRGKHSTGMCVVREKGRDVFYHHIKGIVNPVSFFDHQSVRDMMNLAPRLVCMGHNRFATVGKITQANAHPYLEGHLIGCHNGTISEFKVPKDDEDKVTDSRLLFRMIATEGLQKAVTFAADGAMAITYVNKREQTLNVFRNFKRTLYWMTSKCGNTMYWSSERGALMLLKERVSQNFDDPTMVPPGIHHRIELGKRLRVIGDTIKMPESSTTYYNTYRIGSAFNPGFAEGSEGWDAFESAVDTVTKPAVELKPVSAQRIIDSRKDRHQKLTSIIMAPTKTSVPIVRTKDVVSGSYGRLSPGDWYCGFNNTYNSPESMVAKLKERECTLCPTKPTIFDTIWWHSPTGFVCDACEKKGAKDAVGPLHKGCIKKGH